MRKINTGAKDKSCFPVRSSKAVGALLLSMILVVQAPKPVNAAESTQNNALAFSSNMKRIEASSYQSLGVEVAKEIASKDKYVIATEDDYPDALAGTVLASEIGAPILFVSKKDSSKTLDYLKEVNADSNTQLFILGGTGAVSQDIENNLRTISDKITRLGGKDRFETCSLINNYLKRPEGTNIIVATGRNFPDALSMGAIGGQLQYPIFLTEPGLLPAQIKEQIKALKPSAVYIAGGTGAVSTEIEKEIASICPGSSIQRFAGKDRYDTSMKIADYFKKNISSNIYTTAKDFHAALASAPLASKNKASITLIDNDAYEGQVNSSTHNGFIVGDQTTISKTVENYLTGNITEGKVTVKLVDRQGKKIADDIVYKRPLGQNIELPDYIPNVMVGQKEYGVFSFNDYSNCVTLTKEKPFITNTITFQLVHDYNAPPSSTHFTAFPEGNASGDTSMVVKVGKNIEVSNQVSDFDSDWFTVTNTISDESKIVVTSGKIPKNMKGVKTTLFPWFKCYFTKPGKYTISQDAVDSDGHKMTTIVKTITVIK